MSDALLSFLSAAEQSRIVDAIRAAEANTSGEIKIHIEPSCGKALPYDRAVQVFAALGLHETRARNAVLLYVASEDRRFSFIGDIGIHAAVGDDFWRDAAQAMSLDFKRGAFGDGLIAAVGKIGARLTKGFPPERVKENQLSDEISTPDKLAGGVGKPGT